MKTAMVVAFVIPALPALAGAASIQLLIVGEITRFWIALGVSASVGAAAVIVVWLDSRRFNR